MSEGCQIELYELLGQLVLRAYEDLQVWHPAKIWREPCQKARVHVYPRLRT
jgi:hypothetical protein